MHSALNQTSHRPWPLPDGRWNMRQSWRDLLFAHWPIEAHRLRPLVPAALDIQEFDGTSWIGIVPFRMHGVMLRPFPDLPGVSAFPETNVRLYVEADGKPGVFFLSLDATSRLAVFGGQHFYHLPYFGAEIEVQSHGDLIRHTTSRRGFPEVRFDATFGPTSEIYAADPKSLEAWLTERYCLYAESPRGDLFRTQVHHPAWPLQKAKATIRHNTLAEPHGITLEEPPQLLHFSRQVDVVAWPAERV